MKRKQGRFLSRKTSSRRTLIIAFVAVVFVVACVIAIVIARLSSGHDMINVEQNVDESGSTLSFSEQIYSDATKRFSVYSQDELYGEITSYFESLSATYFDPDKIFDIESIHVTILMENNFYDESIPTIEKLQKLAVSDEQFITVYAYYEIVYGRSCDTSDKSEEYRKKKQELLDKEQEQW